MWTGQMSTDPSEMEARFSSEDGLAFFETLRDTPTEESLKLLEKVRAVMPMLPPKERDFVEMYFFRHRRQTDIAYIFGVSQPTICYRLQRAASRMKYLLSLPSVEEGEIERQMRAFLADPLDVKIMVLMYETTCQSEVASILNQEGKWGTVSQGLVRHRFIRTINRLAQEPELEKFHTIFTMVSNNLNILREVQRPDADDRVMFILH